MIIMNIKVQNSLLIFLFKIQKYKVNIIVWGAPSKLIAENKAIQSLVLEAMDNGVKISGCLHCAQELGVEQELKDLGIDLQYMGVPLTELIKSDANLITIQ